MSAVDPCIVCGSSSGFTPSLRILARCRSCAFLTWPGVGTLDHASLYDERYFREVDYPDYTGNEVSLRRSMARHLRQMTRYGPLGGRLLEIGCAYGYFLDEARAHFERVEGIDVAAGAVARARERFLLDAREGDFLELPFEERSRDAVCLWDTVEHLERPDLYLEKIRRVLKTGGRLYLTTGDVSSLNARLRGSRWRQIHPPSHLHYFSRATIRRLLERVGFEVAGVETAAYHHTVYNVLASVALRPGIPASLARGALRVVGEERARRLGLWLNLGDIMFVAARAGRARPTSTGRADGSTAV